jgi:phosphoglycerate dehydrogenase-like enzyme
LTMPPRGLRIEIVAEPQGLLRNPEASADADILITNHWRTEYPPAPQVRLVESIATGIELIDLAALPHGVVICNAFGHETAIAEYVLMSSSSRSTFKPVSRGKAPH